MTAYAVAPLRNHRRIMADKIDNTAAQHGRFLEDRRLDLGLKWSEIARDMERLYGVSVTADYLSKIKRGVAPLSKMAVDSREALRKVLRISVDQWETTTGLYTPAGEDLVSRVADNIEHMGRRRGPPIPPVVPFRETPVEIPDELQRMIDNNSDRYPQLLDRTIQRIIAAPRNFGGPDNGPQTEDEWLEYWITNRRWFTS